MFMQLPILCVPRPVFELASLRLVSDGFSSHSFSGFTEKG